VPDLPYQVDAFFARALCRSPDGRFQSARALADELEAIASGRLAPRGDETMSLAGSHVVTQAGPRRRPRWAPPLIFAAALLIGVVVLWRVWSTTRRVSAPPLPSPVVASPVKDEPSAVATDNPGPVAQDPAPSTSAPAPRRAPPPPRRSPRAAAPDPKPPPTDPKFGLPTGGSP
jgi:hypothetical protein